MFIWFNCRSSVFTFQCKIIYLYTASLSTVHSEINCNSIADEPTVQGVWRTSGWLPLRCIHLRGLQGESYCLIFLFLSVFFFVSLSHNYAECKSKLKTNQHAIIYNANFVLYLNLNSHHYGSHLDSEMLLKSTLCLKVTFYINTYVV